MKSTEIKTFNGVPIADTKAREELEVVKSQLNGYASKEDLMSKTEKVQIDFDGTNFKHDGQTLNYKQLHDYHRSTPDFTFVVYGDRAYLLSYDQADASVMREMRFQSVLAVTDANGISNVKTSGIYVTSSDGVNITSVKVTDVNSENKSYKVDAITDANKDNTVMYPSVKAVADVESRLSESIVEISESKIAYADYEKVNLVSVINTEKVGYNNANGVEGNTGTYEDGVYTLTNAEGNNKNHGWVFNKPTTANGKYAIGFEYETNANVITLEYRIDGVFKSERIETVKNKTTKFALVVEASETITFYQIHVNGSAYVTRIKNVFVEEFVSFASPFSNHADFLKNNLLEVVTPEMFGAVGDGFADDTIPITSAIEHCNVNGSTLMFNGGKVYGVSAPIDLKTAHGIYIDFNGATIKALKTIGSVFTYDGTGITDVTLRTILRNLTIDCNYKAGGIYLPYSYKFYIDMFLIKNVSTYGIKTIKGGGLICRNGVISGNCTVDSVGMYIGTSDCHFTDIVIVDTKKGIYNAGTNFYSMVHCWLSGKASNSIGFEHMSGYVNLSQCCVDTYQWSWFTHTGNDMALTNCTYYCNPWLYDSDVNPIVFKFVDNVGVTNRSRRVCCNNCSFNIPTNDKNIMPRLADRDYLQISFVGHNHFSNIANVEYANRGDLSLQSDYLMDFQTAEANLYYKNGECVLDMNIRTEKTFANWSAYQIATISPSVYRPSKKITFPCCLSTSEGGGQSTMARITIDTDGSIKLITPTSDMTKLISDMKYILIHARYEPIEVVGN